MLLVLALAALAIYGIVFFVKRAGKGKGAVDPHLKVLARASLGPQSFVAVVSAGSKAWLVGAGEGGVRPIAEITEPETIAAMLSENAARAAEGGERFGSFVSLLRRFTSGTTGGGKEGPSGGGLRVNGLDSKRKRLGRFR
ncbi:MAG: flagellar biosynthetic protein FliO [Treponema sp.]|jgi:flagellar protein FliO/FliZ|nr:flagellar biosynthetic protein FliO [Treponema sp.]